MNTALIVEPRVLQRLPQILQRYMNVLGTEKWKFVFYCGKGRKVLWDRVLDTSMPIEIRELEVDNLNGATYSDLFKQADFWRSLYGEFVLVFQSDSWPLSQEQYTIDYFIAMNKSYIGGNGTGWKETEREGVRFAYANFNGGLSLRKRLDMIRVCEAFPARPTLIPGTASSTLESDAEDVYFTLGCYRLGLPISDDKESAHFAINHHYVDKCFGVHKPNGTARIKVFQNTPEAFIAYL
jgi:hypothetical protein